MTEIKARGYGVVTTNLSEKVRPRQLELTAMNAAPGPIRDNAEEAPLAVSPRKAAACLGVGHDAIYQLLRQGRLRSVKLGRRRLIPMRELERFLTDEMQ